MIHSSYRTQFDGLIEALENGSKLIALVTNLTFNFP